MIKQLSDVLKEVFWIKSSKRKASSAKKTIRKTVKKVAKKTVKKAALKASAARPKKAVIVKEPRSSKNPVKVATRPKGLPLDEGLARVGEITHYFDRIKVCVVKVTQGTVLIGDKLTIAGPKKKLVQKVWSMQVESVDVKVAKKGQLIGLKVDKPVAVGDVVYK